jgi:hypothetical protein
VLDHENAYEDRTVEMLTLFAPLLAMPFADAARAIEKTS